MDNEPYAILNHTDAIAQVVATCIGNGGCTFHEKRLPNGKIADVVWRAETDDIHIFEVKTMLRASLIEAAYDKYWGSCDYLWMVVPGLTDAERERLFALSGWVQKVAAVGLIGVYPCSTAVYHPPRLHRLRGERRLAMLQLLNG